MKATRYLGCRVHEGLAEKESTAIIDHDSLVRTLVFEFEEG